MTTATLEEAEAYSREIYGFSEIDYERNKAAWLTEQTPTKLDPADVLSRLDQFQAEAQARGVTHTTFRRITEALNLSGSQREELRQLLISSRPEQYAAPLWRIPTDDSVTTFFTGARRLAPLTARGPAPGRACAPVSAPLQPGRRPRRAHSMQPPDCQRRGTSWLGRSPALPTAGHSGGVAIVAL